MAFYRFVLASNSFVFKSSVSFTPGFSRVVSAFDANIHSCGAAIRVKPKARLFASLGYEPANVIEPRKGRLRSRILIMTCILCRRFAASRAN